MWRGKLAGTQLPAAPRDKAGSKMRTSEHFSGGTGNSNGSGTGNCNPTKLGANVVMGSFDFKGGGGGGSGYQGASRLLYLIATGTYACLFI